MEFEGQYLTYDEYEELGGDLPEMPFNLLEYEARKQIDLRTHRRLVNEEDIPIEVKMCMFNLVRRIKSYIETVDSVSTDKTSETTDGYSVSYITPEKIKEIMISKNTEIESMMTDYLYGVVVNNQHLLYAGVE